VSQEEEEDLSERPTNSRIILPGNTSRTRHINRKMMGQNDYDEEEEDDEEEQFESEVSEDKEDLGESEEDSNSSLSEFSKIKRA
jgi:hypothetical protein